MRTFSSSTTHLLSRYDADFVYGTSERKVLTGWYAVNTSLVDSVRPVTGEGILGRGSRRSAMSRLLSASRAACGERAKPRIRAKVQCAIERTIGERSHRMICRRLLLLAQNRLL